MDQQRRQIQDQPVNTAPAGNVAVNESFGPARTGRQDFWRGLEAELGLPAGFLEIDDFRRNGGNEQPSPQRPDWNVPDRGPAGHRQRWWQEHEGQYNDRRGQEDPNAYRDRWWQERQRQYNDGYNDNPNAYRDHWWKERQRQYNDGYNDNPNAYRDHWWKERQRQYNDGYSDNPDAYREQWQRERQRQYNDGYYSRDFNTFRDWWQRERQGMTPGCNNNQRDWEQRGRQYNFCDPRNSGYQSDVWQWQNQRRNNGDYCLPYQYDYRNKCGQDNRYYDQRNPNNYRDQRWQNRPGQYNDGYYDQRNPNNYRDQWWQDRQGRYNDGYYDQRNPNNYRDQRWQNRPGQYNDGYYDQRNPNNYRDQWWQDRQGRYNDGYNNDPRYRTNPRDQWNQRGPRGNRIPNGTGDGRWYATDPRNNGQYRDRNYDNRNYDGRQDPRYYEDGRDSRYYNEGRNNSGENFQTQDWQRLAPAMQQLLGRSVSQYDRTVPDRLGCARAVSLALESAYGIPIREQGVERLEDTIRRNGWVQVSTNEIQPGDVIIGKRFAGEKGHAAIYAGNDQIFNNSSNQEKMVVESFGKFRQRRSNGRPEFASVTIYRRR